MYRPYPAPLESELSPITGDKLDLWQRHPGDVERLRYSLDQSVRRVKELLCYFYAVDKASALAHVLEIIDGEQLHSGSGVCKRQRCGDVHEKRNSAADQAASPEDQTAASTGSA